MINLKEILNRDVLAETEKANPGMTRDQAALASLGEFVNHNRMKRELLLSVGDTAFSNTVLDYVNKIEHWGFERVYSEIFHYNEYGSENKIQGSLYVYAHKWGMLLVFDTYGDNVNAARLYLNYKGTSFPSGGSGGMTKKSAKQYEEERKVKGKEANHSKRVYSVYLDAREALLFKISQLEGGIMPVWEDKPFMWILSHHDEKIIYHSGLTHKEEDEKNKELQNARISQFPSWVKQMMGEKNCESD